MENFEEKIREAMKDFQTDQVTRETQLQASSIINEAWLKTLVTLGIEILSKIDTTQTKKEHGDRYVELFKNQLTSTLTRITTNKN